MGGWCRFALGGHWISAHIGVGDIVAVVIGPAVEVALFDEIQFTGREIVAQQVATVIRGVEFAVPGRPVKTHAVAQASGDDVAAAAIGREAHHGVAALILFHADITGRSLGQVQEAVRAHSQGLAPVVALVCETLHHRLVGPRQFAAGAVEGHPANAIRFGDIQIVPDEVHAERALQPIDQRLDRVRAPVPVGVPAQ